MAEIEIFTGPNCSYCEAAKKILKERALFFTELNVADPDVLTAFRARLPRVKSVPQIFVDGTHIGGYEDLQLLANKGALPDSQA